MVSCNINAETRALGQVQGLLESTVSTLYPDHQVTWERFEGEYDVVDDQREEDMEKEGEHEKAKKDKKFQAVDAACGGLVFYRFRINVRPTDYVIKLMDHLRALPDADRKQEIHKIRHCTRWVPLDYICPATTDRIPRCFERLVNEELSKVNKETTVAIVTEIRNNQSFKKETIIELLAPVNLSKPDLVIFCTIFKSVCGMSVLRDYYPRKKYNMLAFLQDANAGDK
ncbi:hypothetical protein BX666DRAFT_2020719 [Dichotomocladium elegans]|nr:hypothetical protein BX666DRAFT_2020719 [Dichotomocladium elegans]